MFDSFVVLLTFDIYNHSLISFPIFSYVSCMIVISKVVLLITCKLENFL
jgi:hypothetical protein